MNKRTPKTLMPAPRPNSARSRRGQDVSSLNVSQMVSSKSDLHHTVRRNLDATISGMPSTGIRPPIESSNLIDCDLEYNEYLVSLMYKQLAEKTINMSKQTINDQILIYSEQLDKLDNSLKDILDKIDTMKQRCNIVQLSGLLADSMSEIQQIIVKYDTEKHLKQLKSNLTTQSNVINTKNIKAITTQEEFDRLVASVRFLKCALEKTTLSNPYINQTADLAVSLKNFSKLMMEVQTIMDKLCERKENVALATLNVASDFFAQQYS